MSKDLEKNTEDLTIKEKETVLIDEEHPAEASKETVGTTPSEEEPETDSEFSYFDAKDQDRSNIINLIEEAEKELADLKFRKFLIESDFTQLLQAYREVFVEQSSPASTIAKASLLEYFTFELLKPLAKIDLQLSRDRFESWETKYFMINYQLFAEKGLEFQLIMPSASGDRFTNPIRLMQIFPETMEVTVLNRGVLSLLKDCYGSHLYSAGQLSFVNHQMNEVMTHMRSLGFNIHDNLLDNSKPLNMSFDLPYVVSNEVLDDIFITTMNNKDYDFLQNAADDYTIDLGHNQTVSVLPTNNKITKVTLNTDKMNKSILEFFGFYPFLVPLIMD